MNGITGLQVAPGENRIGVQREIGNRESADAVKCPDCKTLHAPGFRSATPEKPAPALDGRLDQNLRPVYRAGTLTSASFTASSS